MWAEQRDAIVKNNRESAATCCSDFRRRGEERPELSRRPHDDRLQAGACLEADFPEEGVGLGALDAVHAVIFSLHDESSRVERDEKAIGLPDRILTQGDESEGVDREEGDEGIEEVRGDEGRPHGVGANAEVQNGVEAASREERGEKGRVAL